MERLTKKHDGSGSYTQFGDKYIPNHNIRHKQCVEKLGKLEDIEQELGVPLEALFKAMEGCFYKVGDEITDGRMDYFYKSVGGEWMAKFIPNGWILGTLDRSQIRHYLKDYGKTWWLEKPEVKNETTKN